MKDQLHMFLQWWLQGLVDCLPAALQRLGSGQVRQVRIVLGPQRISLIGMRGLRAGRHETFNNDESGYRRLARRLAAVRRRGAQVLLTTADVRVLERSVVLPAATEENLHAVIGFEMDRLTPYRAEDVFFAAELAERLPEEEKIRVRLRIVPRAQVQRPLEALQAAGIVADGLHHFDHGGRSLIILFDPGTPTSAERSKAKQWNMALTTLCVVLLIAAVAVPIARNKTLLAAIEAREAAARKEAMAAVAIRDELQRNASVQQTLMEMRLSRPSAIEVVEQLSALLPDHTWLFRFDLKDTEITLQGESAAATELIGILENAEQFANVRFSAPTQQNPRSGRERFSLNAELVGGR
jgi:general secretion pathway protein L